MAGKSSAGLVIYRRRLGACEVFLVHPGGPFWKTKDLGAWSIPKGESAPDEDPLGAARREFAEETGRDIPGEFQPLPPIRQPSGKTIHAWAVEGDCDPAGIKSNTVSIEWPPRSGTVRAFPEIDRARGSRWMTRGSGSPRGSEASWINSVNGLGETLARRPTGRGLPRTRREGHEGPW